MDGTQVAVVGLDEIMAELHSRGREPTREAAEEMLHRLEARNYIPSSESTRREYRHLLFTEYKEYRGNMSIPTNPGVGCCAAVATGSRLLTFPDGCQVSVNGLDGIFEENYQEGKSADRTAAKEMVVRLAKNNYVPSSAWSEYEEVILKEYEKFLKGKQKC